MKHYIDNYGTVLVEIFWFDAVCRYFRGEDVRILSGIDTVPIRSIKSFLKKSIYVIYIGDMKSLADEFSTKFNSIDDIASYYRKYNTLPFGIKTMCKKNKWKISPEAGTLYSLIDTHSGDVYKFYKNGRCL